MNLPQTLGKKSPPLIWSDYVFILLLILILITVSWLGRDIYIQGDKLERARDNAEIVMAWANTLDEEFEAGKPISPSQCTPTSAKAPTKPTFEPNTWGACVAALFGPLGKFPEIKNTFMSNGAIWTKKCERENFESKGALFFERISPGPSGAPIYSEFKDSDLLISGMDFRISICDRGFRLVKVGEAKL